MLNPFAAPQADLTLQAQGDTVSNLPHCSPTFIAWERLRVVFNGWLTMWCLLVTSVSGAWIEPRLWLLAIEGAIVANVCFCAGPVAEGYASLLGLRGRWVRLFLFIGGTALASVLALATLFSMLLPAPD